MENKIITKWINEHRDELIELTSSIFCRPETAYNEHFACDLLSDYLAKAGFGVAKNAAGLDTAFVAEWGSGTPIIGFLAEYDALPGLGHACGHNLLGTASVAAACAFRAYLEESGASGTVRLYGTPAEEIMSGKIVMNEQHLFDDLDVAVTWHPFDRNRVSNDIWPAIDIKNYRFKGISSHASKSPELGRSALDAAELMNVGVNYLREHVPSDVRMQYAYIDNGIPANIVPDVAKTNYFIRSSRRDHTEDASRRVDLCAKGAAMMTETEVEIDLIGSCDEMKLNRPLMEIFYEAMKEVEVPTYTEDELAVAADISKKYGLKNDGVYFSGLEELENEPQLIFIGTDAAQVSHTVPLVTVSAQAMCRGTALHHPATAEQAGMSIGHKGMLYAAACMAEGSRKLVETEGALERVKEYHNK